MTIPVSTTTISVLRRVAPLPGAPVDRDPWADGYEEPIDTPSPADQRTAIATGIRAVISVDSGQATLGDGQRTTYTLLCDPVDLTSLDLVKDEVTEQTYRVAWSMNSPGVAGFLASTRAGLTDLSGFGESED